MIGLHSLSLSLPLVVSVRNVTFERNGEYDVSVSECVCVCEWHFKPFWPKKHLDFLCTVDDAINGSGYVVDDCLRCRCRLRIVGEDACAR